MTIIEHLPQWLRGRRKRPAPQDSRTLHEKAQPIPSKATKPARSVTAALEKSTPLGQHLLWRL